MKDRRIEDVLALFPDTEVDQWQQTNGGAWIHKAARIANTATVIENAVCGYYTTVGEYATVRGFTVMRGQSEVRGKALVYGRVNLTGNAQVYGNARVGDDVSLSGNTQVRGNTAVLDQADIRGTSDICGNAIVRGKSIIQSAIVTGDSSVTGNTELPPGAYVFDQMRISGGKFTQSPIYIRSSKYALYETRPGVIRIGKEEKSAADWMTAISTDPRFTDVTKELVTYLQAINCVTQIRN